MPIPPSDPAALAGATVLLNLSAARSPSARRRRGGCSASRSQRPCLAAYLYAAAGQGESTTDLGWDGQAEIFENGAAAGRERALPARTRSCAIADIDLDLLRQERMRQGTFEDNRRASPAAAGYRTIALPAATRRTTISGSGGRSSGSRSSPPTRERLAQDCYEAYNIQVDGLVQRLRAINTERVVIGVSGGLDSTHALIVAARAMDLLGLPRTNILALHHARLRHRRAPPRPTPGR